MKINVTDHINDYENKPVQSQDGNVTWRTIFFTALNSFAQNETPTAEQKSKSYMLTKKVYDGKEIDLSVSERAYMLERIEKIYPSPLICGRAKELFEGGEELKQTKVSETIVEPLDK